MRRILLIPLLALAVVALIPSPQARAWTGDLPKCSGMPEYNWSAKINELWTDSSGGYDINWSTDSVVAYRTATTRADYISILVVKPVDSSLGFPYEFYQDGTTRSTRYAPNSNGTNTDFTHSGNFELNRTSPTGMQYRQSTVSNLTSATCMQAVANVKYHASYTGTRYSTDLDDPSAPSACPSGLDGITCTLGNIFSGIGDGFNIVGQAIVQGIATLFMPSPELMSTMFDDLKLLMTEKLGLLFYPFDFFGGAYTQITNSGTNFEDQCNWSINGYEYADTGTGSDTFFGSPFTFNYCGMETLSSSFYTTVKLFVQIAITLTLIWGLYYRWSEITKGYRQY